jgi:hypothetical protein
MDFLTLLGLGLYGNTVNKYDEYIEYKNELGNIPRYYDNIYSCNQINNNRKKVYLKASNNYLKSLEPNTNIINNIWRFQKKDTYNQIFQNDIYMQPIQPMQSIQSMQSMQPIQSMQSMQPMQPIQSMQSMQPMQPIQPMQSIQPIQPMQSIQPMQPIQSMQPMQPIQSMKEREIHEPFITDGITTFFDRIRNYSLISVICLIVLSCLCCCM